jgi:hypothetical protein
VQPRIALGFNDDLQFQATLSAFIGVDAHPGIFSASSAFSPLSFVVAPSRVAFLQFPFQCRSDGIVHAPFGQQDLSKQKVKQPFRMAEFHSNGYFLTLLVRISPSGGWRTRLLHVLSPRPARGERIGGDGRWLVPHSVLLLLHLLK